jgi:hypothetical protein
MRGYYPTRVQRIGAWRILGGMRASIGWVLASLVACGGSPPPVAPTSPIANTAPAPAPALAGTPMPSGATVGTAHPILTERWARDGSWIAICQARHDTDGDGKIELHLGYHGDIYGDALTPYLVRHDGEGEPIDALVSAQRDRWVAAMRGGKLALFDAQRGTWTELPADVRDDGVPVGPHRAASVASAGDRMVYFKDDTTMIVRELSTGAEKAVVVPGVRLWRVEVEPLGGWAKVLVIAKDTDGDGTLAWPSLQTSLSGRGCRGPVMSYSTGGWAGDAWEERWLDLATGTMAAHRGAGPSEPPEEPELGEVDGRRVLAVDAAGKKLLGPAPMANHALSAGPLEWVTP